MIKDCSSCIHNRVCSHKGKNEEYKQQMKELIEKWGEDNGFGFTEDCPEWHSQPNKKIEFPKLALDEETKKNIKSLSNQRYIQIVPVKDEDIDEIIKAFAKDINKYANTIGKSLKSIYGRI